MTAVDAFPHLRDIVPMLDGSVVFDDVVGVSAGGPSQLVADHASGARTLFTVSAVGQALRLRCGEPASTPSPLLVEFTELDVAVTDTADGVSIRWAEGEATWTTSHGLVAGAWKSAPTSGMGGDSPTLFARIVIDGNAHGWLLTSSLGPEDAVFGGGESFTSVDHRGRVRRCLNDETHGVGGLDVSYLNVPFFWSADHRGEGWGITVHTGAPIVADLGATHCDMATFAVEGETLDVVLSSGPPAAHLATYHRISGLPGSVPDWSFGTWSSRCSYFSEAELHEIVDGYDDAGIALDVVHVDCWLEGNTIRDLTCNWTVDRARFPDGWVERLGARGVRVSLWHNPFVLADSALAASLDQRGLLLRNAAGEPCRTSDKDDRVVLDLTNPDTVRWWKDRISETVATEGNHSFKPDFSEEVPLDAVAHDGRSGRALRNEYSVRYQAATHEALTEARGEAVLFCRSGTVGAQRYPGHWVGDTPSTWQGLAQALRACLSLSTTGFGVVTADTGGFYVAGSWDALFAAADADDPSPYVADVEDELFVRWSQWAALSPLLRFHGTGRREPWAYAEDVCGRVAEFVAKRELLRPYLVDVAADAARTGTPMMRPPVLHTPERPDAYRSLQYLLGADVLVAPLLTPEARRRVFVPDGTWLPIAGLTRVVGEQWIEVDCDATQFPAWVREGSTAASLLGARA